MAAGDLVMCDVERHFVYAVTPKRKAIAKIQEDSLVVFRLPGFQAHSPPN